MLCLTPTYIPKKPVIQTDTTYLVVPFSLTHKRNLPMLLTTKANSYQ